MRHLGGDRQQFLDLSMPLTYGGTIFITEVELKQLLCKLLHTVTFYSEWVLCPRGLGAQFLVLRTGQKP